jgi:hypothetical protein
MNRLITPLLALLLSAVAAVAQTARVQIAHNSPDPTVDVYVNNLLAFDDFAFRTATPFLDLPAGIPLTIAVAPSTSGSAAEAVASFDVTFESGQTYFVAASGIVGNPATPFTLIADPSAQEIATDGVGNVNLSVLHGAPDAPAVDVVVRTVGKIVSNLSYGEFTPYLSVPAGEYYLDVKPAGSETIVGTYRADLSAAGGAAIKVMASGLLGVPNSFGLYAVFADGTVSALPLSPVARVQIIHNSPSPTVDIYANGDQLLNDFAYRTATPFIFVPADVAINLGVALSTSVSVDDTLVNFTATFENGKTYIVTASGIVGDAVTPFGLNINDNGRETSAASGKVDIAVLHGSTDAPAVDVDAVFVANNVISNLAYGQFTPYLSLDPGKYDFAVRPSGSNTVVASYRADLSGLADGAAYVFASGLLAGNPDFGLFAALPNGTVLALPLTPTARVQVVHNAPDPVVDVYAGNSLLLNDFAFRTATPFIDVPADRDIAVGFALANSNSVDDVLFSFPASFEAGKTYAVFANGIPGNATTPLTLAVTEAREAAANSGDVDVAVLHGSPDAPAVDVDAVFVAYNLIQNLAYGEFTSYLNLPPAVYDLAVRPAGAPNAVATFRADLGGLAGGAGIVFASGLLGGSPAFGLYVVLANGTVVPLPLTPTARVQVVHNAPDPVVDVYAGNTLLLNDFAFRTATPFIDVPADRAIAVGFALANSNSVDDVLFSFPASFETGKTYAVFANGIPGNATTPLTLAVTEAREAATNSGDVDVAVLHGSPDAPAVDVDAVFVANNLIQNLAYGEFTSYLNLPPAVYDLAVRPAGAPNAVATFRADLGGLAGGAGIVFASGLLGGSPAFGLYVVLADGTVAPLPLTPTTRVQIVHNSPEPTVDVYAGNTLLLNDFAFRTATPFVDFPADRNVSIGVAPGTSNSVDDIIASFPANFSATRAYTVFANGVVGSPTTPFGLVVADDARETAGASQTAVSVFHGSPDAPAVDVVERLAGVLVSDLAYGELTPYLDLVSAEYYLDIKPAGNDQIVATYRADLSGLEGLAIRVFASGFLAGTPGFGLYAVLPDGTVAPLPLSPVARVQVIHNSPAPTVDVYAEGGLFLNDFQFRSATPYVYVPAEFQINFGIAPGNSQSVTDTLVNFPVTFENGKTYVVVASGIVGNGQTPFTLLVNDMGRERGVDINNFDVSILHGAPDAPAVDIRSYFDNVTVLPGAEYGDFTDYLSIPAQPLYLEVVPTSAPTQTVGIWGGDFTGLGGIAMVVYASGLLADGSFDLWATLPDGFTFPLPSFSQVQVIHNSPDPTVDVYYADDFFTDGVLVLDDFEFRQATNFGLFPARTPFSLAVAGENSDDITDAIYTLPVSGLETGKTYLIMASGVVGGNPGFELVVSDQGRVRAQDPGLVEFTVFHGSPDAPEVDVTLYNGPVIVDNVAYGEFSEYLGVPATDYVISITPANDNNTVVQSYQAPLTGLEGQALTVFASGFLASQPGFELWVATSEGVTFPLPVFVSTNELDRLLESVQVAPNPATDETWVRLGLTQGENLRYALRDAAGRLILEGDFGWVPAGEFSQRIEVGSLAAGMYQLEIRSDAGVRTQKLVIQR